MAYLGIDLGTTNSVAIIYNDKNDSLDVVRIDGTDEILPSVVSYTEEGITVGSEAKNGAIIYPESTVQSVKRIMGTSEILNINGEKRTPEEVCAEILKKLKTEAENQAGEVFSEVVITHPAYYNDRQIFATRQAGLTAGFENVYLLSEPLSAAIEYGYRQSYAQTLLVYDLGGGTFDVTVLEKYNNIMEVRAVAGDIFLGGEDFTEILEKLFLEKIKIDKETLSQTDIAIIKKSVETAKHKFVETQIVTVETVVNETQYSSEISLEEYTSHCEDLLSRLRSSIKNAMADAETPLNQINNIILVGGATKLPIIKNFVSKLFGRFPLSTINPDEVVGVGAAVHAALKERNEAVSEMILTDVCPFTLGVESSTKQANGLHYGDLYTPIIERNTIIPVSRVERFSTMHDGQDSVLCRVLQGENRKASENSLLGELVIPIPKADAGVEAADVRFTYNINGILEVEVTIVSNQFKKTLIIDKNPGIFTQEEIEQKFVDLADFKIHPREKEENRLLLSRGERMYQENLGDIRTLINKELMEFDIALDSQDERKIRDEAVKLKKFLDSLER